MSEVIFFNCPSVKTTDEWRLVVDEKRKKKEKSLAGSIKAGRRRSDVCQKLGCMKSLFKAQVSISTASAS